MYSLLWLTDKSWGQYVIKIDYLQFFLNMHSDITWLIFAGYFNVGKIFANNTTKTITLIIIIIISTICNIDTFHNQINAQWNIKSSPSYIFLS